MKESIEGIGKFNFIDYMVDGEGIRVIRRFIKEVTIKMAHNSANYINSVGYPPFIYKEKQLHTIMAPAINSASEAFLMESQVTREWSSISKENLSDSHGWVDYWCLYKDYNYYIELKHGFISYRSGQFRQSVTNEWQTACDQLSVIQEEINSQLEFARGIFKIAFQVLPVYIRSKKDINLNFNKDKIYYIQIKAMEAISKNKPANWSCVWILDDAISDVYEFDDSFETYPAILFLANISEIEKNKH